ncbi:hypothetical protein CQA77_30325, partial [Klebsiella pneumoniae]
ARDADKVALLLKVWRQRLSYRPVRSAEESKIALSSAASVETARDADKVALLLKVWRQRLSYRPVRSAEESKIA